MRNLNRTLLVWSAAILVYLLIGIASRAIYKSEYSVYVFALLMAITFGSIATALVIDYRKVRKEGGQKLAPKGATYLTYLLVVAAGVAFYWFLKRLERV